MSLLALGALLAQDVDQTVVVRYPSVTTLEFHEQSVAGALVSPAGAVLYERKRAAFAPLIALRRDFNAEITDSAAIIGGATGI